jgi:hypothetical protein
MRKGFLIFEQIFPIQYMRWPLVIYDFAPDPLNFLINEENFISFFISALFHKIILLHYILKRTTLFAPAALHPPPLYSLEMF